MKTFKTHLNEAISSSDIGSLVFDIEDWFSTKIPLSTPMMQRLFGKKRYRGFHITIPENLTKLKSMQNSSKALSLLSDAHPETIFGGIASGGGIVAECEGDLLMSSYTDLFSDLESKQGRRWVKLNSLFNKSASTGKRVYGGMLKELLKYIAKNKIDFMKNGSSYLERNTYDNDLVPWMALYDKVESFEVKDLIRSGWKLHANGKPITGRDKAKAIKFYFDTWEKYIRSNMNIFSKAFFSGLDGGTIGDEEEGVDWDEHIINKVKVTKLFILYAGEFEPTDDEEFNGHLKLAKKLFPRAKIETFNDVTQMKRYMQKTSGLIK